MSEVTNAINHTVRRFLENLLIAPAVEAEQFGPNDLLLINNSFVYRDKRSIKTTKSEKYLAVEVNDQSAISDEILVINGLHINSDWKRIPASQRDQLGEQPIADAVFEQLSDLGRLVFILIGEVDDTIVIRQAISSSQYSELVWDPSASDPINIHDGVITVRDTSDEEAIWSEIEAFHQSQGEDAPGSLRDALAVSLEKAKDQAVANLILPSPSSVSSLSMIDSITRVLEEQRNEYADALSDATAHGRVSNDILRIAYNFASDALIFIRLMVSVCDLKPLVLWGTIAEHYEIAESLRNLPWYRHRSKPSLSNYRSTITDARNSAFHNLFPFRKTLQVHLPDAALQDAMLLIFSEHGKKSNNQLIFQDKELVDLLFEFTRARERRVPLSFWQRNLQVMEKTIDLCDSTGQFLKLLLRDAP